MALPQSKIYYTPEQYLAMEREAEFRHEYIDGYVFAMAGESFAHGRIKMDTASALNIQLKGKTCEVFTSDTKVRTPDIRVFGYPDILVVCGQPIHHDHYQDVLLNPKVIIEVLSPSTEAYDRGSKFASYRKLEALTDYILISQDQYRIEHYVRQTNNFWLMSEETDLSKSLIIESIGCELSLSEVYARVKIEPVEKPELST